MTQIIVTAQRLLDARVVYLRADRTWSERDAEAFVGDAASIEPLLAWAKAQTTSVVDVYGVEVLVVDGRIEHTSARERYRAAGPSAVLARFGYLREGRPARAAVG